jgi:predicted nucleotidyltransferase
MTYDVNLKELCSKFSQPWLYDRTLYLTVHGSHCYGTNTPTSDLDLRGICVAPKEYYIGLLDRFDQAITNEPTDLTIFDIKKFTKLAMDCNPNALEILFTEDRFHLVRKPEIEPLFDIKDSFLSKKARWTFSGYARSQLNRILSHRRWLLNPPKKEPERTDFGLTERYQDIPKAKFDQIEAEVRKVIDEWVFDSTGLDNDTAINIRNNIADILVKMRLNADDMEMYAARSIGLNDNLLDLFNKERTYRQAVKEFQSYQNWKKNRNKTRAEIEEKFQYDCKHASHLVRLYLQCETLFKTGELKVFRDDAEFLLSIKNGSWKYDQVVEFANQKDKELEELYKTSSLRHEPQRNKINDAVIKIIEKVSF